jgi:hypothetical protein
MSNFPFPNFDEHQVISTGGFLYSLMAGIGMVKPTGDQKQIERFLHSEDAGYCLDAPYMMPAGAMRLDPGSRRPVQFFIDRVG